MAVLGDRLGLVDQGRITAVGLPFEDLSRPSKKRGGFTDQDERVVGRVTSVKLGVVNRLTFPAGWDDLLYSARVCIADKLNSRSLAEDIACP